MEMVTISNPLPDRKGTNFRGKRAIVVRKHKDTVVVKGLEGTYGAECIFNNDEVTFDEPTMVFKDEGGYYTYKLTADGKPADSNEMYEFGSLQTLAAKTRKEAKQIAKGFGFKADFF